MQSSRLVIGYCGLIFAIEAPQINRRPASLAGRVRYSQSCYPSSVSTIAPDTGVTAGPVRSGRSIPHVFCVRSLAQVGKPVVRPITVDVVDDISRPFVMVYSPSHPVAPEPVPDTIDCQAHQNVTAVGHAPRLLAAKSCVPSLFRSGVRKIACRSGFPENLSGVGVVCQQLTQLFRRGKGFGSHGAILIRSVVVRAGLALVAPSSPPNLPAERIRHKHQGRL